jgi:auxin efflux carrier family protein
MDYVGPDVESEEVRAAIRIKRKAIVYGWMRKFWPLIHSRYMSHDEEDDIKVKVEERKSEDAGMFSRRRESMTSNKYVATDDATTVTPTVGVLSHIGTTSQTELGVLSLSPITSPEPTIVAGDTHTMRKADHHHREHSHLQFVLPTHTRPSSSPPMMPPKTLSQPSHEQLSTSKKILNHGISFLKSLVNPCSIVILSSFLIALVPSLKALFVTVPSVHMASAPDGLPPLAFLFDATVFIGGASVPLGLICLGSALARLNVPRDREGWRTLPIGAITGLAVGRMIVMPVLGVLLVQGLVKGGVLSREDKVLQFVCMWVTFLSSRLF